MVVSNMVLVMVGVRTVVHHKTQNKNLKKSAECKHLKQMNHDLTCLTNANKLSRVATRS